MFPVFLHLEFPSECTVVGVCMWRDVFSGWWLDGGLHLLFTGMSGPFGFPWYVHFFLAITLRA